MDEGNSSNYITANRDEEYQEFDTIIGHIEDILVDNEFNELMKDFMENNWETFEDNEENKFVYLDIFNEYTNMIENYIDNYLTSKIPSFSMEHFFRMLEENKDMLDGEVFEMLFTMSDFLKFKETMLDYRNMKERQNQNLNLTACIKSLLKKTNENSD